MSNKAKVLFEINRPKINDFVMNSKEQFTTIIIEDSINVLVKPSSITDMKLDDLRMLAGSIAKKLKTHKIEEAEVCAKELTKAVKSFSEKETVAAFVEGFQLGNYQFDKYVSKKVGKAVSLHMKNANETDVERAKIRAKAVSFARNLSNELSSELNPESFPQVLIEEFSSEDVQITVHDKEALERMEMAGVLAVNKGSKYQPAFVEIHYQANREKPLVALVGKGVTFDTGGISLKSGRNISDMRMDMGGAAAVCGAMKLLVDSKADVNVVALIPMVENMPDRYAMLPGDIIKYKTKQTVQVGNTDAEGRLILADALIRAEELKADYIFDIATLTGAMVNALGTKVAGIFGDEELMFAMKGIGDQNGDFVWPMPLIDEYDQTLKSPYADFANISNMAAAGSITAALFLRRFISRKNRWIHIDMAGTMEGKNKGYYSEEGTGFGARLLADFAIEVSKK